MPTTRIESFEPDQPTLQVVATPGKGIPVLATQPAVVLHQAATSGAGGAVLKLTTDNPDAPLLVLDGGFTETGELNVSGDLNILSTQDDQYRIHTYSYQETDSSGSSETIRLHFGNAKGKQGNASKNAIAFIDDSINPEVSQVWVQSHRYLRYLNRVVFASTAVNIANDRITATAHGLPTTPSWKGQFTTTGTLPAGLSLATDYYAKRIDANTLEMYTDAAAVVSKVDITTQGTGTHTFTPDLSYFNNDHRHFSVEVSNSDLSNKNTRFSIPWGLDWTQIGFFQGDVNVNGGKFRITGSSGSFRQMQFCNTLSSNLVPDGTEGRWSVQADNTAEAGSNVGSDFRITRYTDAGVATDAPFFIKRSNGNVGIGTITPGTRLDVNGATVLRTRLTVGSDTSDANRRFYIEDATATSQTVLFRTTVAGTANQSVLAIETFDSTKRALDIRVTGDGVARLRITAAGVIELGDGVSNDVNMYRSAATVLKSDDKVIAALGIGVGNSVAATTLGTLSRKMEVFDAAGASVGFLPIYTSIT